MGFLHALQGVGNRAFYRWLEREYAALFPKLPERTRLFRLFKTHQNGTRRFLGQPSLLSVIDSCFHSVIEWFKDDGVILSDTGVHAKSGDPDNLKCCKRRTWNDRMLIETVFSMLTTVCHLKKVSPRVEGYFQARLAFTTAVFNLLICWKDWQPDTSGFVPISIAEFSL